MSYLKNLQESIEILSNSSVDWSMMAGPLWLVCGLGVAAIATTIYAFATEQW